MVQLVHDSGEPYETVRQTNHLFDIVWDDRVTPAMLRLYLALASYVDRNGNCSPPRSVLAYRLNRKPHPISVAMAGLKQTGWVVETPITTPGGHRLRTAYHLPRLGQWLTQLGQPLTQVGSLTDLTLGQSLTQPSGPSDEIVTPPSLEVTGPQPVSSGPEGPEVPPVPSPEVPVLVEPEVTPVPTPEPVVPAPSSVEPLSPKARAFMEAHRAAFALRRPYSLNPALRVELEQAVEDLGLDRLLVTLHQWAVLKDVRPIISIIRGCRTTREGPEKQALDQKRAVRAVPKPTQNGRSSGMRQVSRQQFSAAHMVIADRLRGEDVPDSEVADDVLEEVKRLEAQGWQPGDPYD